MFDHVVAIDRLSGLPYILGEKQTPWQTLEGRATQLLIDYGSGALVTQKLSFKQPLIEAWLEVIKDLDLNCGTKHHFENIGQNWAEQRGLIQFLCGIVTLR